jgi:hypothetical protein
MKRLRVETRREFDDVGLRQLVAVADKPGSDFDVVVVQRFTGMHAALLVGGMRTYLFCADCGQAAAANPPLVTLSNHRHLCTETRAILAHYSTKYALQSRKIK